MSHTCCTRKIKANKFVQRRTNRVPKIIFQFSLRASEFVSVYLPIKITDTTDGMHLKL